MLSSWSRSQKGCI